MSLIIEGMKMPEYKDVFGDERGCVYLLMLTVNKDSTASMQFNDVDGGFHRVKEIPTPHDRLIDERAFKTAHPLMVDLKSCPFCGSKAEFVVINRENRDTTKPHIIRCVDTFRCGAQIEDYISNWSRDYKEQVKKLFNRWNRRISNEK